MAKRDLLKLPDDFLGTVKAFLNTPKPPKKAKRKSAKRKASKDAIGAK